VYHTHTIDRDGVRLALHLEDGDGPLVVFQHGLCGDARQPADVFPHGGMARHAVLDCRGHGGSEAGPHDVLSIATFSDDLAAGMAAAGMGRCIVGGISMGAAIALRLACARPDLVSGLILARPAWACEARPENMAPNLAVGEILSKAPDTDECERFLASATGQKLEREAPDNLASLLGFFTRQPRDVTAALLTRISRDGPGITREQAAALSVPTLVIGHDEDLIHPMALAQDLANLIPGARLAKIPPKASDKAGYQAAFRSELARFIKETSNAQTRSRMV
jgi:pimeloyl-ACP methyl ester carboxylesterase